MSLWLEFAGVGVGLLDIELALVKLSGAASEGVTEGVADRSGRVIAVLFVFALPFAGLLLAGKEPPQPMAIRPEPVKTRINIFLNISLDLARFKYGCAGLSVASPGVSDGVQTGTGRY